MIQATDFYSRGSIISQYVAGLLVAVALRLLMSQLAERGLQRGLIKGYGATVDHDQLGRPLTAFISITPIDPSQPDDYPERLVGIEEIESCWSVAGEEAYILKIRVATPLALEELLARIRGVASVSTRTTIVLSTPYENRPID